MKGSEPDERYRKEETWEEKARENPLYAVMSVDDFLASGETPTEEELERFFEDGRRKVRKWFYPWLLETETTEDMGVLEFGCGMGRLLKALAEHHPPRKLHGIDISETMISHAGRYLPESVQLDVVMPDGGFPHPDGFVDRVISYAVFQHISSKRVVKKSIAEIARVLKPGGRVKLQFEMIAPPSFTKGFSKKSFALERASFVYGLGSRYPLPVVRLLKSNHWGGVRLGYGQILREFRRNGITVNGLRAEVSGPRNVWLYGYKER